MFGILLPLYTQSPRDQQSVQWWPVRKLVPLTGDGVASTVVVGINCPLEHCWILDGVFLAGRSGAGAPASRIVDRILSLNDTMPAGAAAWPLLANLWREQALGPVAPAMDFRRPLEQPIFVAAGNRIQYEVRFDQANIDNAASIHIVGVGFPRGNLAF